jgi:hypothetical protein
MPDQRTKYEKMMWDKVGPPLYYCSDCMKAVEVTPVVGGEPIVKRPCNQDCGHQIIAPRKAIATGKGGASMQTKITLSWWKLKALLTGRCA